MMSTCPSSYDSPLLSTRILNGKDKPASGGHCEHSVHTDEYSTNIFILRRFSYIFDHLFPYTLICNTVS